MINLDLDKIEENARDYLKAQASMVLNTVQPAPDAKAEEVTPIEEVSSRASVVINLRLDDDSTNVGSDFEACPTPLIPIDVPHASKVDAFAQYAKTYPTEPQAIQNFLLYANNLANASLLTAEMKKQLIQSITQATMNSTTRASVKGYQGLRGEEGSASFVNDALSSFKPVEATSSNEAVVLQTLRALNGKLLTTDSEENHPTSKEMYAQNKGLLDSIGMPTSNKGSSAPNSLGSKKPASAPAPKAPQTTDSAPTLPTPVLPESGSVAPYNFPKNPSTIGLKGIKDYYSQLIMYIHAHPTDITAMNHLMEFLVDVSKAYGGKIPADVQEVLNAGGNGAGALDAIRSFIPRLEQYAFFTGFSVGGQTLTGKAGMQAYVNAMKNALGTVPHSPYTDAMTAALASDSTIAQYAKMHTDADGDLIYTVQLPNPVLGANYSVTYDWNGKPGTNDELGPQYYILQQINSRGPDLLNAGALPDPFNVALDKESNDILTTYRVSALKDLLAQFKDPLTAISIWIMTSFDNQYQTQEGGLNDTTDLLTEMTNSVATRLSTLAQNIGFTGYDPVTGMPTGQKMTADQVQEFINTLSNGTGLMDSLYQLNGISSEWDTNVFKDICGIPLINPQKIMPNGTQGGPAYNTDPTKGTVFPATVGQLLFGKKADGTPLYTPAEQATFLSTLKMGPPPIPPYDPSGKTPPYEPPAETQGFQQVVSDLQQAGSFITGRSKTVTQQLTQTTDLDSSAIKAFSTMLQDLQQFIIKGPIAGQKQN